MPDISRSQFMTQFRNGIDLNKPGVAEGLQTQPGLLEKLKGLANGEGVVPASALGRAWTLVDGFDNNGRSASINSSGAAGDIYRALSGGSVAGTSNVQTPQTTSTRYSDKIAKAATDRAAADSAGYAVPNAPTSPFKNLSGNKIPGQSRPSWLEGYNKCNQFVGDALTQAGMRMPTYKMTNGSEHYVNAEKLPNYNKHFDRVTDPKDIRPGDVLVWDYPGSGESTAHTEVVTGASGGNIKSTGAHYDGAYEKDRGNMFEGLSYDAANKRWDSGGTQVYVLRPKMPVTSAPPVRA